MDRCSDSGWTTTTLLLPSLPLFVCEPLLVKAILPSEASAATLLLLPLLPRIFDGLILAGLFGVFFFIDWGRAPLTSRGDKEDVARATSAIAAVGLRRRRCCCREDVSLLVTMITDKEWRCCG